MASVNFIARQARTINQYVVASASNGVGGGEDVKGSGRGLF